MVGNCVVQLLLNRIFHTKILNDFTLAKVLAKSYRLTFNTERYCPMSTINATSRNHWLSRKLNDRFPCLFINWADSPHSKCKRPTTPLRLSQRIAQW